MTGRSVGRARRGLLISLAAACFVISGALATPAHGREAKEPGAKRAKKKGQDADAKKKNRGKGGAIRLAMLNDKRVEALFGKLDANGDGNVTIDEFKTLPTVLQEMAKEAAAKAKARAADKKAGGGAKDPNKKGKGGGKRKKKDATQ